MPLFDLEAQEEGQYDLFEDWTSGHISATWRLDPTGFQGRGVVEANRVTGDDDWWLTRARLVPDRMQRRGIGTRLLRTLLDACARAGATCVKVTPGGYAEDPKAQRNFYLKSGFVPNGEEEGLLEWRPCEK